MVTNLDLAILALDAYNRDGGGLDLTGDIGDFERLTSSNVGNFSAQAYYNGTVTVISLPPVRSYRTVGARYRKA